MIIKMHYQRACLLLSGITLITAEGMGQVGPQEEEIAFLELRYIVPHNFLSFSFPNIYEFILGMEMPDTIKRLPDRIFKGKGGSGINILFIFRLHYSRIFLAD